MRGLSRDWKPAQQSSGRENPNAWGGVLGISTNPALQPQSRVLIIDTPMMDQPTIWYLNFLFANALPTSPNIPNIFFASTTSDCVVTINRYLTPIGGQVTDTYTLSHASGDFRKPTWLPVSTVVARKLQVIVEITDAAPLRSVLWVNATASPLSTITKEQLLEQRTTDESGGRSGNIFGYAVSSGASPAAPAVAAILDPADATRRQFFITNETDKRLAVGFGFAPAFAPAPVWTFALDPKGSGGRTVYESPLDVFWGDLWVIAEGGATGNVVFSRNQMFI